MKVTVIPIVYNRHSDTNCIRQAQWYQLYTTGTVIPIVYDRHSDTNCIQQAHVPKWITKGKTMLIQKDFLKETAQINYRPITCLPMMWKIFTAQIREEIYNKLTSRGLFPEKQKGRRKWSRSTAELLHIEQHIIDESKISPKNRAMTCIDYKNAYYMVLQSWIINCLKMSKISDEVKTLWRKPWKLGEWNWQQEEEI